MPLAIPLDAIFLDFEARSRVNLKTEGLAKYARCKSTAVLCGQSLNPHTKQSNLWLPGQPPPDFSDKIIFGWNVGFEKIIWEYVLHWPAPKGWYDVAGHSRYAGCPGKLETASEWFNLGELGKNPRGKYLINTLCVPLTTGFKKWKLNKGDFCNDPELLQELYGYCAQDNFAALAIYNLLPPWPEQEQAIWKMTLDQNERGCPIDVELCHAIISLCDQYLTGAKDLIFKATGGAIVSPTQTKALLTWLNSKGINVDNVDKHTVAKLLSDKTLAPDIRSVISARQIAAPASLKKFASALGKQVNERLYHNFIYCGGGATGRWSGGGKGEDSDSVQLQNLYRGKQSDAMLDIIKLQDADFLASVATAINSKGDDTTNPVAYAIKEMQNSVRSLLCAS